MGRGEEYKWKGMSNREMKRKLLIAMAGLVGCMWLAGCGEKPEEIPQVTVEKVEPPGSTGQEQEEEPKEPEPEEREAVDGKMQSFLTGEWKDEKVVNRRPIAVMIPNNSPAMPQYAISRASIIYEAPVEGRITRLMGILTT